MKRMTPEALQIYLRKLRDQLFRERSEEEALIVLQARAPAQRNESVDL